MACPPTLKELNVMIAAPPLSATVPSTVLPSMNVTVPVRIPAAGELIETLAVNVTD